MIFNDSIWGGIVPDAMKLAEVVHLCNGKSKSILNNYRPNSLLTTLSKILEKNGLQMNIELYGKNKPA